ncbi:hypothetical protein COCVIDRAFT_24176 [Bipolaris victoriae FI3]|uniref:Uncharacterized protein n=1 Tax=Bipolaris victoriae (strain FI3) TaxID=930091 RepID=W7F0W6_BIPV3|nr:hypothetical protein COCVIDRAFT_24176 [Bipolaris victoriae FI3]
MAPSFIFRIDEMKNISEQHESRAIYYLCDGRKIIPLSRATKGLAVGAATVASLVMNEYQRAVMAQQPSTEQRSSRILPSFVLGSLFGHEKVSSESGQSVSILQEVIRTVITFEQQPQRLLDIIPNPGPVHLVVACLVYSAAINVFYHIHKRDRYQLGIVACGTISALAVGWASKQDTKDVITGLGTWAVMASLLLSAAFHKLLREYGEEARMPS